jgi:hypothetical protein
MADARFEHFQFARKNLQLAKSKAHLSRRRDVAEQVRPRPVEIKRSLHLMAPATVAADVALKLAP